MDVRASEKGRHYTIEDYYNTPEGARVELIDGVFYDMAGPGRIHQKLLMEIAARIHEYIRSKGGDCEVYPAPFDVQLFEDEDTVVQPDISVICDKDLLTDKGCTGAPDWIIEIISPGNPGYDYIKKYRKYEQAGVREYWMVDPGAKNIIVRDFSIGGPEPEAEYSFSDTVRPGIYEDLAIDFSEIEKLL